MSDRVNSPTRTHDLKGRPYAKLSQLKVGDFVVVDDGFEGCFISWSELEVKKDDEGELALAHNVAECGACGGSPEDGDCLHNFDGQLEPDGDTLIGIYRAKDFYP